MPHSEAPPLAILHVFSTFAVGGPQVRTASLIQHFGPRYRHSIVAMDGNYACAERIAPGAEVRYPKLDIRKGDTMGNRARFRAYLRQSRPDVLVTSNWGTIEWAMANLPMVVRQIHVEDGFGPEERNQQIRRRVLTRRLLLGFRDVVLPSQTLLRIARDVWRLPTQRLHYIPNGIDLAAFGHPVDPGISADWSGTGPVIGTVAALRAEKNLPRLMRAFAIVRDRMVARLVIVGDGGERPALASLAAELGVAESVHFTGHMAQPQSVIGAFDLFALSSDTEQMPLSVLEAMAAGLAVVSTDVGDVRAMLAPENDAFVVGLEDGLLADGLTRLLASDRLRQGIGAANRAKAVRQFDQKEMFTTYADLWDGRLGAEPDRQ
jgi:glycosyltransferase involved in cell wall biosynthesis